MCVCMCICICMYVYVYVCIYIYVFMYMYIYISHAGVGMWIAGLSFIAVQYIGEGGYDIFTKSLSFIVWKLLI